MDNNEPQDQFTEILQHRIKFWLEGEDAPTELDEASEEHIERMIRQGFREGELLVMGGEDFQTEFRGWWGIHA